MATKNLKTNIIADEIIPVGTTIELTLPTAVDARSAQGAIRVFRGCQWLNVQIDLAKGDRVILVHLEETIIGACQLVVSELLSVNGKKLLDSYVLPFAVIPISGKIPKELRVEHA